MTKRVAAWMAFYGGEAALNGSEAARLAGYKHPGQAAYEIRLKWPAEVEKIELEWKNRKRLSDEELEEIPAEIARTKGTSEQSRLKALELIARLRGKLSDKVTINVTRSEMMKQLDEALATLAKVGGNKSDSDAVEALADPTSQEHTITPVIGTSQKAN